MKILIEKEYGESTKVKVGNIYFLKENSFKDEKFINIIKSNHRFLVVSLSPIIVCPISSQMKQLNNDVSTILINGWKNAGLNKPSYVGLDTSGAIKKSDIDSYVGKLSESDYKNIINAYRVTSRRQIIEDLELNM